MREDHIYRKNPCVQCINCVTRRGSFLARGGNLCHKKQILARTAATVYVPTHSMTNQSETPCHHLDEYRSVQYDVGKLNFLGGAELLIHNYYGVAGFGGACLQPSEIKFCFDIVPAHTSFMFAQPYRPPASHDLIPYCNASCITPRV